MVKFAVVLQFVVPKLFLLTVIRKPFSRLNVPVS